MLYDRLGGWRRELDLVDALSRQVPGSDTANGTIFEISFNPRSASDPQVVASQASERLVAGRVAISVSAPRMIEAGEDENISVLFQEIIYDSKDPSKHSERRRGYAIYFNNDGIVTALHVVPGRANNARTLEFVHQTILRSFRLNQ
jgi:hypothetical protein